MKKKRSGEGREETDVIVRTPLACGEDSLVDALFEILGILEVLPEEDQPCSWATECLVPARKKSNFRTEHAKR